MAQGHWLHGSTSRNGARAIATRTLAICRTLALARAVFKEAIAKKPADRITMRSRTPVVKRHPEGDW